MADNRLIGGAVAFGAAVIAAGILLGRRDAAPEPPPRPTAASVGSATPTTPPVDPVAAIEERARAETIAVVAAKKPELTKKCWEPSLKGASEPKTASYFLQINIDPQGRPAGVVIAMPRVGSRTDVWMCLRGVPLDFVVTPPGRPVYVEVPLNFP